MIAEVQYALSWRKEATGRLVNFAAPGTQVRPEARFILGGEPPQSFVVKRTYESIIRWIIKRLSSGSGRPLETFLAVSDGPGMYIAEEAWTVPPPSRKPDLYVFYDDRSRQSGELKTANPVSVQTRLHSNLGVGLSSSGLLPTPLDAQAGVGYEKQLAYELYAVSDPSSTPSTPRSRWSWPRASGARPCCGCSHTPPAGRSWPSGSPTPMAGRWPPRS